MVAICIAVFALLAGAWWFVRRKRHTASVNKGQKTEKEAESKITETEKDGKNMAVEKNTTYRVVWTDYEGRAGARAMTSSSSPGIALKQEGISYLAAAEIPAVILNVMRGGGYGMPYAPLFC